MKGKCKVQTLVKAIKKELQMNFDQKKCSSSLHVVHVTGRKEKTSISDIAGSCHFHGMNIPR